MDNQPPLPSSPSKKYARLSTECLFVVVLLLLFSSHSAAVSALPTSLSFVCCLYVVACLLCSGSLLKNIKIHLFSFSCCNHTAQSRLSSRDTNALSVMQSDCMQTSASISRVAFSFPLPLLAYPSTTVYVYSPLR